MVAQKKYKGLLNEAEIRLHHAYGFIENALIELNNVSNIEKENNVLCRIQSEVYRLAGDINCLLKQPLNQPYNK